MEQLDRCSIKRNSADKLLLLLVGDEGFDGPDDGPSDDEMNGGL